MRTAVNDAKTVASAFEGVHFNHDNISLLVEDGKTTRKAVIQALRDTMDKVKKLDGAQEANATIVIYFAGHGVNLSGKNYLLLRDTAPSDTVSIEENGISTEVLLSIIANHQSAAKVGQVIFILDACRTPAVDGFGKRLSEEKYNPPFRLSYLFSTKDGYPSLEFEGDRNSVFTAAFVASLKGADRKTIDDIAGEIDSAYDNYEGRKLTVGNSERLRTQSVDSTPYSFRRPVKAVEQTDELAQSRSEYARMQLTQMQNTQLLDEKKQLEKVKERLEDEKLVLQGENHRMVLKVKRAEKQLVPPPYTFASAAAAPPMPATCRPEVYSDTEFDPKQSGLPVVRQIFARSGEACLTALAARGNTKAHYILGEAYLSGLLPDHSSAVTAKKEPELAVWHLREAALAGNARAMTTLGYYFCCTDATIKNEAEALAWFHMAASRGSLRAKSNIAWSLMNGSGTKQNIDGAVPYIEAVLAAGATFAYTQMGDLYYYKSYGRQDIPKALGYYAEAFKRGEFDAAAKLGYYYATKTNGVVPDAKRGLEWYTQGAAEGCKSCWYSAGQMHENGDLGTVSLSKAMSFYEGGSGAGDADSMTALARLLSAPQTDKPSGIFLPADPKKAFELYDRAATYGNWEAKGHAGKALAEGKGIDKNPVRAASLLREVLANDDETQPIALRYAVYELQYWGFGVTLSKLIESKEIPPLTSTELGDLKARYGRSTSMKRFTVPVDCAGEKVPIAIYVKDWERPFDETIEGQVDWLKEQRGCTVPTDVQESFRKLKVIARQNKVSFEDLTVYALGAAQAGQKKDASGTATTAK